MAERKDLISISEALGISNSSVAESSNTELLRSIVSKLQTLKTIDVVDSDISYLSKDVLPESLAFPASSRVRMGQSDASLVWDGLKKLQSFLRSDHSCRRQMLLNRLDCTVESFKWKGSESKGTEEQNKAKKSLNDAIQEVYDRARADLKEEPNVTLSHLLALRETECDILLNNVVSTRKVDCKIVYKQEQSSAKKSTGGDQTTNLKQVIISDVPDRGGRTNEIACPPVQESFSQQRRNFRGRGGRR